MICRAEMGGPCARGVSGSAGGGVKNDALAVRAGDFRGDRKGRGNQGRTKLNRAWPSRMNERGSLGEERSSVLGERAGDHPRQPPLSTCEKSGTSRPERKREGALDKQTREVRALT